MHWCMPFSFCPHSLSREVDRLIWLWFLYYSSVLKSIWNRERVSPYGAFNHHLPSIRLKDSLCSLLLHFTPLCWGEVRRNQREQLGRGARFPTQMHKGSTSPEYRPKATWENSWNGWLHWWLSMEGFGWSCLSQMCVARHVLLNA